MQTTLSVTKINLLMDSQLLYPEIIREQLERLYEVARSNYIFKNKNKFNFMKFGYDSEQTLSHQFESIFKDYKELYKEIDTLKHLHCIEPWQISEMKYLFKIHSCLCVLQKIMRLHLMSSNPVQITYEESGWIAYFYKHEHNIRDFINNN